MARVRHRRGRRTSRCCAHQATGWNATLTDRSQTHGTSRWSRPNRRKSAAPEDRPARAPRVPGRGRGRHAAWIHPGACRRVEPKRRRALRCATAQSGNARYSGTLHRRPPGSAHDPDQRRRKASRRARIPRRAGHVSRDQSTRSSLTEPSLRIREQDLRRELQQSTWTSDLDESQRPHPTTTSRCGNRLCCGNTRCRFAEGPPAGQQLPHRPLAEVAGAFAPPAGLCSRADSGFYSQPARARGSAIAHLGGDGLEAVALSIARSAQPTFSPASTSGGGRQRIRDPHTTTHSSRCVRHGSEGALSFQQALLTVNPGGHLIDPRLISLVAGGPRDHAAWASDTSGASARGAVDQRRGGELAHALFTARGLRLDGGGTLGARRALSIGRRALCPNATGRTRPRL